MSYGEYVTWLGVTSAAQRSLYSRENSGRTSKVRRLELSAKVGSREQLRSPRLRACPGVQQRAISFSR